MNVYLVRQSQAIDYMNEKTIAVYDDLQRATDLARALNKEYGKGCRFSAEGDFCEVLDYVSLHYYDVETQTLNPNEKHYGIGD